MPVAQMEARATILVPSSQVPDSLAGCHLGAHALAREQDLRAELVGLLARALGELRAAGALGKAEIVLDLGARRGLPADRPSLHQNSLQTVGGAIDRGAQPRRPSAVDRQVVLRARRVGEPAELLDHLADRRRLHAGAVREFADRQARLRVAFERDPLEGNIAALQEIAQLVRLGRAQAAIDLHEGRLSAGGPGHGQSYRRISRRVESPPLKATESWQSGRMRRS